MGGQEVIIHYDDVPESDITIIDGLRCTTALRTVIDLASEVSSAQLEGMLEQCFTRRLFTVSEATARLSAPDMLGHPGAEVLRRALIPWARAGL
jgi:hypothetical protein